jgi:hypothetical protein
MNALQFLASLPAVLGLAGFVIFYFLRRNQGEIRLLGRSWRSYAEGLPTVCPRIQKTSLQQR